MNIQMKNKTYQNNNLINKKQHISSVSKPQYVKNIPHQVHINSSYIPLSKSHVITKEEQAIHEKYLKPLSLLNLPNYLLQKSMQSQAQHMQDLKNKQLAEKFPFNVYLPNVKNINMNRLLCLPPSQVIKKIRVYKKQLYVKAAQGLVDRNLNEKRTYLSSKYLKRNDFITNLYIHYGLYGKNIKKILKKTLKKTINKKSSLTFTQNRKKNSKIYKKKLLFLKKKETRVRLKFFLKKKKKLKPVFKPQPRPLLPWIAQGRKQHNQLKKALVTLHFQLSMEIKRNRIPLLSRQNRKLIKQFRKNRKYGKFARYGKFSRRYWSKKFPKFAHFRQITKIKRQNLYLQHKRLSSINSNTINSFKQKYMYMLLIVWYLLLNIFLPLYKNVIYCEIWLNFFLANLWVYQAYPQINNFYLNYVINAGLQSYITVSNIYTPSRNALYNELEVFKIHQRLIVNNKRSLNKNAKSIFRFKRKSKIRTFFRISPKLRNKKNRTNRFNKRIKNKNSKRLAEKEWLLVSKFTRTRYQHHFSSLFRNWKNIKKIHKYIDKQSHVWHQPYIITHPYYYTTRYKTFVYDMFYK